MYGNCKCGAPLRDAGVYILTCDNPECEFHQARVDVGWRVVSTDRTIRSSVIWGYERGFRQANEFVNLRSLPRYRQLYPSYTFHVERTWRRIV